MKTLIDEIDRIANDEANDDRLRVEAQRIARLIRAIHKFTADMTSPSAESELRVALMEYVKG